MRIGGGRCWQVERSLKEVVAIRLSRAQFIKGVPFANVAFFITLRRPLS
ncbi:MAG: hypothetical protein RLZZ561_1563 [Pseudomonadota bacterium]